MSPAQTIASSEDHRRDPVRPHPTPRARGRAPPPPTSREHRTSGGGPPASGRARIPTRRSTRALPARAGTRGPKRLGTGTRGRRPPPTRQPAGAPPGRLRARPSFGTRRLQPPPGPRPGGRTELASEQEHGQEDGADHECRPHPVVHPSSLPRDLLRSSPKRRSRSRVLPKRLPKLLPHGTRATEGPSRRSRCRRAAREGSWKSGVPRSSGSADRGPGCPGRTGEPAARASSRVSAVTPPGRQSPHGLQDLVPAPVGQRQSTGPGSRSAAVSRLGPGQGFAGPRAGAGRCRRWSGPAPPVASTPGPRP